MDHEDTPGLLRRALAGDREAQSRLVAVLTPVIQKRVARTLLAHQPCGARRDVHQEVQDLVQEVFLSLFDHDARVLRRWQAERGLSLENFVGLAAKCLVISRLRSSKRSPWQEDPMPDEDLDRPAPDCGPEQAAASREELELLLDRFEEVLTPQGLYMFDLLYVRELSVPEAMAESGLSDDAVYAWKSRLRGLAHELRAELSGSPGPPRRPKKDG